MKNRENILSNEQYRQMANAIRFLSMDAVQKAQSGHPGMPMGMADVATVLFSEFLNFDPKDPFWPNRDRFILSAGHGSMLQYSLLYLTGYEDITIEDIKSFRQLHAKTAGHPEYGYLQGVETTTGPLGQGLANAVGMAMAEKLASTRFGSKLVDHHTYVIVGDGCLMEGISHEAISLAGHLNLNKLVVLFDDNKICIDGPTSMTNSDNHKARFEAFGWYVQEIDGHNPGEIRQALANAKKSDKPSMIAARTVIGFGAPTKAGTSGCHGSPLGKDEIEGARKALGWSSEPFIVPQELLESWREIGQNAGLAHKEWQDNNNNKQINDYKNFLQSELPSNFDEIIAGLKTEFAANNKPEATRKSSGNVLEKLTSLLPGLIGGSADLTGSNNTKTGALAPITKDNFAGRYVYYGVREHAMGAIMNGMALYGGFIPYGGTFLVFSDYMRPAIRLSALMKQRVIYVMTHDSIGLGEDGPTHQPVEHVASLRLIPNLYVYRPADRIETLECWELALRQKHAPSLISLTRQDLIQTRIDGKENLSAKGGYILKEHSGKLDVTIFATGSEVEIALASQAQLEASGVGVRVVSVPCTRLFDEQGSDYIYNITCNSSLKVAIEAGVRGCWDKYIGPHGIFIGMNSFGESAPYQDLYKYFGITVEETVKRVMEALKR